MLNVIPRPIQEMVLRGDRRMTCSATALFADVSGFTSMTESLMAYGRKGADALSGILNGIFSGAVEDILRHGGCILYFQGDALAALFPPAASDSALICAERLSGRFGSGRLVRTDLGEWEVSVRIGVAAGAIEWGILGNSRLTHFTRGAALGRAVELAAACEPGGVLSDTSSSPSAGNCTSCSLSGRIHRKVAARFTPGEILESRLTGEFRDIVPVFLNLRGDPAELDLLIEQSLDLAGTYGGFWSGIFFPMEVAHALVLFGAPVSSEDNTSRACDFALELSGRLGGSVKAGLSAGMVYAGITGSSRRCSYTVFGDTVNTAARLVQVCDWGGVLAASSVASRTGSTFEWGDGDLLTLKGRSTTTGVMRLIRRIETGSWDFKGEMVGRRRELRLLARRLAPLLEGNAGGTTIIYGEAGVGKSRLLSEAVGALGDRSQTFIMRCDEMKGRSLGPVSGLLRNVFRQGAPSSRTENRFVFLSRVQDLRSDLSRLGTADAGRASADLERVVPVLESVLGLGPDLDYTESGRFERVVHAVTTLTRCLALIRPLVLVVEDLQWMDRDTERLLEQLRPAISDLPSTLLATSRFRDDGSRPELEPMLDSDLALELGEMDRDGAGKLMSYRLHGPVSNELFDFLWEQTGGSPFFVEQFCMFIEDEGMLRTGREGLRFVPGRPLVPSGIRDLLVARMDRLNVRLRELVLTASVLGTEFDVRVLTAASDEGSTRAMLDQGVSNRLWTRISETTLAFEHSLLRRAAYGMLMPGRLRKLHSRAAEAILDVNRMATGPVAGRAAMHFHTAERSEDAMEWGLVALSYAAELNLNGEVLDWSERLRDWLEGTEDDQGAVLLDILENRNQALNTLGRRSEQLINLEEMLEICSGSDSEMRMPGICKLLGDYHYVTGDLAEASSWYSRGMELARRNDDKSMEGVLMGNMGILHAVQGRARLAMQHYEEAKGIHRATGNRRMEGIVTGNMAILLRQHGKDTMKEAHSHYLEALHIHREVGNRTGEGAVLLGLGNLETASENEEKAREHYLQALEIDREVGHRRNEGYVLVALGILETIGGNFDRALVYLREGLDVQREIGDLGGEALVLTHIGITYSKLEDGASAQRFLLEALEVRRRIGDRRGICIVLGNLGEVLIASGDRDGAKVKYLEAVAIVEELDLPQGEMEGVVELYTSLRSSGASSESIPFPGGWNPPEVNPG